MKLLVTLILVSFEHSSIYGLTIPTKKHDQLKTLKPEMDLKADRSTVFRVDKSGKEMIKFVHPKSDKPSLLDIIYYHVIERPYGEHEKFTISSESEGPDFDDTRRPFTNSHGFPFGGDQEGEDNTNEQSKEDPQEDSDITECDNDDCYVDSDNNEYGEGGEEDNEEMYNGDEFEGDEPTVKEDEEKMIEEPESEDDAVGEIDERKELELEEQKGSIANDEPVTEVLVEKNDRSEETIETKDDVVEEKKSARNQLFSQMRNKYKNFRKYSTVTENSSRRKREIDMTNIPEAPKLADEDYAPFPKHWTSGFAIDETISKNKEETEEGKEKEYNEEEFKEELQEKIEEMIANMKPNKHNDKDVTYDKHHDETKREARTYGISLVEGRGRVWNNLWTDPGVSYDVGSLETVQEDKKEPTKDLDSLDHITIVSHPTESKPIININENKDESDSDGNASEEKKVTEDKDQEKVENTEDLGLDDIFVDKINQVLDKESKDNSSPAEETENKEKEELVTEVNQSNNEKEIAETSETSIENSEKTQQDEGILDKKDSEEAVAKTGPSDNRDIIDELMKNEQFWKWLGDWTATYMELLMKHIKRQVRDEVSRQMANFTSKIKKDLEDKEGKNQPNDDVAKNDENIVAKDEPEITDGKIIIDGKELPLTHNSNLDGGEDLLKRKKEDKDKNKEITTPNKSETAVNVNAQNVFGDSAGSDHVTNVFIFYPNKDDIKNLVPVTPDINSIVQKPDSSESYQPHKEEETTEKITTDKPDEKSESNIEEQKEDSKLSEQKDKIDGEKEVEKQMEQNKNGNDDKLNDNKNEGVDVTETEVAPTNPDSNKKVSDSDKTEDNNPKEPKIDVSTDNTSDVKPESTNKDSEVADISKDPTEDKETGEETKIEESESKNQSNNVATEKNNVDNDEVTEKVEKEETIKESNEKENLEGAEKDSSKTEEVIEIEKHDS